MKTKEFIETFGPYGAMPVPEAGDTFTTLAAETHNLMVDFCAEALERLQMQAT